MIHGYTDPTLLGLGPEKFVSYETMKQTSSKKGRRIFQIFREYFLKLITYVKGEIYDKILFFLYP